MEQLLAVVESITKNRYLTAGVVAFGAFVAAWVVDFVISRVCLVMARRTQATLDDDLVRILHFPVRATVFFVGLGIAVGYLALGDSATGRLRDAFDLIMLLVWTVFAFRFVSLLIKSMAANPRIGLVVPRTEPIFGNLARVLIIGAVIYLFFLIIGVQPTAWLASAGVIGLAVGFAAKDTLANLFAGIFILADAPYKVGDMVNLDGGDRGQVTHIGLRSTRLLRRDDVEITLPNAVIANAKILNESGGPSQKHRISVSVGVAYGSDVDKVQRILEGIAAANDKTADYPEPRVRFRTFGDSALSFDLLAWIEDPQDRGLTIHELNCAIAKRFAEEGVTIPFPQRDLWIKQAPPGIE